MSRARRTRRSAVAAAVLVTAGVVASGTTTVAKQRPDLGELDPSFNRSSLVTEPGVVTTPVGIDGEVGGLVEQPGGKIVAAGAANLQSVALVRYDKGGTVDRGFGTDGFAVATGLPFAMVGGLHVQGRGGNGALVTAGGFEDGFFALRHDADGRLDPSFGVGGRSTISVDGFDEGSDSALQPDGKVLVVGSAGNPFAGTLAIALGRFDADGGPDASFGGGDGYVTLQVMEGTDGYGVDVQDDGRIVVVGQATQPVAQGGRVMTVARFLPDGTVDPSFGAGAGHVNLEIGFETGGFDVAVVGERILVSGTANANDEQGWVIARFLPDGSLDTSFGAPNGYVTAAPGAPDVTDGIAFALGIRPNGGILVAGSFGPNPAVSDFYVAGFTRDGVLDADFGDDGFTDTPIGSFSEPGTLLIQRNGRVVVGGTANLGSVFVFALARYIG